MWHRQVGAFFKLGPSKDLLLPFREQVDPVQPRQKVVVFVLLDERSDRIIATTRLNRHLSRQPVTYKPGQEVSLIITNRTPLGYNALIEKKHLGLLHQNRAGSGLLPGRKFADSSLPFIPTGKSISALMPLVTNVWPPSPSAFLKP